MELQLEELEADAGEDELAAEIAAKASTVKAFERRRPSRKPFPEHLPRERVVIAAPAILAAILSAGAGHGSYVAARVLFPFFSAAHAV